MIVWTCRVKTTFGCRQWMDDEIIILHAADRGSGSESVSFVDPIINEQIAS
jgi:hypothetical protein